MLFRSLKQSKVQNGAEHFSNISPETYWEHLCQLLSQAKQWGNKDEKGVTPSLEKLLGWRWRKIWLSIFKFPASVGTQQRPVHLAKDNYWYHEDSLGAPDRFQRGKPRTYVLHVVTRRWSTAPCRMLPQSQCSHDHYLADGPIFPLLKMCPAPEGLIPKNLFPLPINHSRLWTQLQECQQTVKAQHWLRCWAGSDAAGTVTFSSLGRRGSFWSCLHMDRTDQRSRGAGRKQITWNC